jgi:transcriptional regulator with PAS, ATPase and Fis domain
VKLLRALQEGEIVRLGSSKTIRVDVRIVAATNRTLTEEIAAARFREDLFYRLAVAILQIPPLRKRAGDVGVLVDHVLAQVNLESASDPGFKEKKLSAGARNLLLQHPWPGNVRELVNTLKRAAIWSEGSAISAEDVRDAILPVASARSQEVLGRALGNGFDLETVLQDVARHYLERAMTETQNNKTKAAELVGLKSYQTLTNWLAKYEVQS